MAGYLFEYASAAKSPARVSRVLLQLLVGFSVPKQPFAPSKTMADSPTDIDVVFAFKRQNVAKERFYSVVHLPPLRASPVRFPQSSRSTTGFPQRFSGRIRGNNTPKLFNKTGHYSHARLWPFV